MNSIKQKILLLLGAGIGFTFAYHPGAKLRTFQDTYYEWRKINEKDLQKELEILYRSQYIKRKRNSDGSFSIFLTNKGRIRAIHCKFPELMKKKEWDKKWRIVIFDVPEKIRQGRNALRYKLKELGFYKLQESVFVFPYECRKEINVIVKFFKMEKYVQYGVLESIDGNSELKKTFKLN